MSCGVKGGSIGGGGGICVGGGGGGFSGGSGKGIKITSSGSSRGFSRRSYGGGPCRSIGGGFSSGSCGRISRGGVCYGGSSYGGGSYSGGRFGGGGYYGGGYGSGGYGEGGYYPFSSGSFGFGGGDGGLLSTNEKTTMQSLNERLALYLDRVRVLEEENAELESSIREWYQKYGGTTAPRDYSPYYQEIDQLYNELVCETDEYNKYLLNIDNTRMTAEDFKLKYQTECGLRQNVEADINGLRPLLDQLTLARSDLEMQFESLREELICLKKNHEEAMRGLTSQSGLGNVNVEVNAAPGIDLKQRLDELRAEYEQLIERNRREVESWYESKMEEVRQEVNVSGQEITSVNRQVTELRREYQNLEIELQSQLSMIQSLQSNLEDTERRYNMQLQQIQAMINPVEAELASIRCEIENQNQEYQLLLGIKTRLEQEICQYRRLLEEGQQEIGSAGYGIGYGGGRRGSIGRIGTGGGIIGGGGGSGGRIGGGIIGGGGGSCGVIGGGGGSIGVGSIGGGGSCTDIGGGGSQVCGGGISTSAPCYPQPVQPCKPGYGRKSCD